MDWVQIWSSPCVSTVCCVVCRTPELAYIPPETKRALERLSNISDCHIVVISGRNLEDLQVRQLRRNPKAARRRMAKGSERRISNQLNVGSFCQPYVRLRVSPLFHYDISTE